MQVWPSIKVIASYRGKKILACSYHRIFLAYISQHKRKLSPKPAKTFHLFLPWKMSLFDKKNCSSSVISVLWTRLFRTQTPWVSFVGSPSEKVWTTQLIGLNFIQLQNWALQVHSKPSFQQHQELNLVFVFWIFGLLWLINYQSNNKQESYSL